MFHSERKLRSGQKQWGVCRWECAQDARGFRRQLLVLAGVVLVDVMLLGMAITVILGDGAGWIWDHMEHEVSGDQALIDPSSIQRVAALTFDDGPNRVYTEKLLDGLKERDVKASFFLVGACMEGNEAIVERMASEGHLIGVHCMQHTDLTKESQGEAIRQLKETGEKIMTVTGVWPEYVRPPYGSWNEQLGDAVREELHLTPAFWDVDSLDWKLQNTGKIVKKVMNDVENGDVILLHDEFGTSVEAAFQIIDNLMAKGYTFVTIDELMVD